MVVVVVPTIRVLLVYISNNGSSRDNFVRRTILLTLNLFVTSFVTSPIKTFKSDERLLIFAKHAVHKNGE